MNDPQNHFVPSKIINLVRMLLEDAHLRHRHAANAGESLENLRLARDVMGLRSGRSAPLNLP